MAESKPKQNRQDDWRKCGAYLVKRAGLEDKWGSRIPNQIYADSINQEPKFLSHLLAMAYVESRFDYAAKSPAGARGILQVTRIGAEAAAESCFLPILSGTNLHLLYKPKLNVLYASCLFQRYLTETKNNWTHALILYNGGYRQLKRFRETGTLSEETTRYIAHVQHARALCLATKL
jgi:soluble lytic murein transglycosylase-like protein